MADKDGKIAPLSINLIPGKLAPRFDVAMTEIHPLNVYITEQGMKSGKPMVDIHFEDAQGNRYVFITSGAILRMLGSVIGGVNLRNHGTEDP